eukprot:gene7093-19017_t
MGDVPPADPAAYRQAPYPLPSPVPPPPAVAAVPPLPGGALLSP